VFLVYLLVDRFYWVIGYAISDLLARTR